MLEAEVDERGPRLAGRGRPLRLLWGPEWKSTSRRWRRNLISTQVGTQPCRARPAASRAWEGATASGGAPVERLRPRRERARGPRHLEERDSPRARDRRQLVAISIGRRSKPPNSNPESWTVFATRATLPPQEIHNLNEHNGVARLVRTPAGQNARTALLASVLQLLARPPRPFFTRTAAQRP